MKEGRALKAKKVGGKKAKAKAKVPPKAGSKASGLSGAVCRQRRMVP